MKILIIFSLFVLFPNTLNGYACDCVDIGGKTPLTIEERINELEKFDLDQRNRNGELDEKIEMLAEKSGYGWRRQLNSGNWIKRKGR